MRIPNKFNGYMSDGRRLYPDPATSAIIATALTEAAPVAAATTAEGLTAASLAAGAGASAIPGIVGSAAPELLGAGAAPLAQGLGAGAQAMSPEIAANLAQSQAVNAGVNQGIMQAAAPAADQTAAMGLNQVGALNPANAPPMGNLPVTPSVSNVPTGLQSATTPSPVNPGYESAVAHTKDIETAANVGKEFEAAQAAEKYEAMNPLEKGFTKAKEFAGDVSKFTKDHPYLTQGGIMLAQNLMKPSYSQPAKKDYSGKGGPGAKYTAPTTGIYEATPEFRSTGYAVGGPVEQMSAQNSISGNTMYPQSQYQTPMYSNPMVQRPMPTNVINSGIDTPVDPYSGEQRFGVGGDVNAFDKLMKEEEARRKKNDAQARSDIEEGKAIAAKGVKPYSRTQTSNSPYAAAVKELQGLGKKYGIKMATPAKTNVDLMGDQDQIEYAANGGIMHGLGGYSDGGRLLKGPGDGVSDSIPAVIGNKQPARLADGEFVVPARIVSELGNGSTEAGARKLYAMMERIQKQRGKTVGKNKVAVNSKASKHLPA
jgi:hypothetical protein